MRAVRYALVMALAFIAAPASAEWYDLPFPSTIPPAEAPLENLYVQFVGEEAPTRVVDVIMQPPHVGHMASPKLQLPQYVSLTRLKDNVTTRGFKQFDLNGDGNLNRSELTQGMLAWAISSVKGQDFTKAMFFYGTAPNALAPLPFFVLNHDDSAYVRRVIVQHGRIGSTEMLGAIASAG